MADLGEEAYSSQMKVIATFLRLLEELMRNKQQDLRYGTKTQRRGIFRRMKDFVGGVFKKVYDGTFGRLSRNGKDYGQLDLNDPAVAKLFADTMKQMGMDQKQPLSCISMPSLDQVHLRSITLPGNLHHQQQRKMEQKKFLCHS